MYTSIKDLNEKQINSLCNLANESFGVKISKNEILEKLDSSVLLLPYIQEKLIGFFSTDILEIIQIDHFSFLDMYYQRNCKFGIYNSGGVISNNFQNKGLYTKIRDCFTTEDLDFISTRTQNLAVYKAFRNIYGDNIIPNRIRNPNFSEKEIGYEIAEYLECKDNFNSDSFICKNVYEGSRNNVGFIDGLSEKDAYILLHTKNETNKKN